MSIKLITYQFDQCANALFDHAKNIIDFI